MVQLTKVTPAGQKSMRKKVLYNHFLSLGTYLLSQRTKPLPKSKRRWWLLTNAEHDFHVFCLAGWQRLLHTHSKEKDFNVSQVQSMYHHHSQSLDHTALHYCSTELKVTTQTHFESKNCVGSTEVPFCQHRGMLRIFLKGIHSKPATETREWLPTERQHSQEQVLSTSFSAAAITVTGWKPREHTEAWLGGFSCQLSFSSGQSGLCTAGCEWRSHPGHKSGLCGVDGCSYSETKLIGAQV